MRWVFTKQITARAFILLLFAIPVSQPGPWIWAFLPHQTSNEHPSNASKSEGFDGPAELPRSDVVSSLRATPAPGKILKVGAGENPSQALSKASCGDTIQLQAGATFSSLVLPEKNCDDSHWIIVRTSAPDSKLPA